MNLQIPGPGGRLLSPKSFLLLICLMYLPARAALNPFGFTALSGVTLEDTLSTTQLIGQNQNNISTGVSAVTSIGFNFILNGVTYTQFSVNENGLMRLGSTVVSIGSTTANVLNSSSDLPKITAYFDDMKTQTGTVRYKVIGSSPNRKLMVQWNVTIGSTLNSKFQVWLFETSNNIQFVYGQNITSNSLNYSAGVATATTDFASITVSSTFANSTISYASSNDLNQAAVTSGNSFLLAAPPSCPVLSSPLSGATGVQPNNLTLSWAAGATGQTTGYDVYFGTSASPPVVSTNQAGTTYNAGTLNPGTVYYWKVIGRNGFAFSSGCTVNQFTTKSIINFDVTRTSGIAFNSIASTGNVIPSWKNGNNTDDNLSNSVPIGFNFNYGGINYSNLLISTNGFVTFNTATSALGGSNTPYGYNDSVLANYYSSPSTLMLAPYYYDMVCQGNSNLQSGLDGSIRYSLTGSAGSRVMTIEWSGMELFVSAGPNLNFQVKLYESSNNIDFIYGTMEGFNGTFNHTYSASIGLNGASLSNPPVAGEVFNQLTSNTRNFGITPFCNQNTVPECNSLLHFTPGNYTAYVPPATNRPVNDSLGSPIQLFVNPFPCIELCGSYYSSANATSSGRPGCSSSNADDDVWFTFTAPSTSSATIKVLGSGNYDATAELFSSAMVSLACANTIMQPTNNIETITSNLTIGQQYFVRVFHRGTGWNVNSSSGQFSICVSSTPLPPSNDECSNAIILPVTSSVSYVQGTSSYAATASPGVPVCSVSGANPDDDVWYKFTATNQVEIVSILGHTGFNAAVQLLNGTCNSLAPILCVDNFGNGQNETLTANNLVPNSVYYIRVFHSGIGGGTGNYGISVYSPPPSCVTAMAPTNLSTDIPVSGTDLFWDSVPGATAYRILLDTINPPAHVLYTTNGSTFSVNTGILTGSKTYYWTVQTGNSVGFNSSCQVISFNTEATPFLLRVKVFLEAIYNGNYTMKPLIDPLDTLADTVTISLADDTRNIVYSANSYISVNGWAYGHFPIGVDQSAFYIVIDHRNSLQVWTPNLFPFNVVDTTYIFSDSASKAFGNNQIQLSPGLFGLYVGDLNQDGAIDYLDMDDFKNAASLFTTGIANEDINCDGFVESIDGSMLENKFPLQLSVQIP